MGQTSEDYSGCSVIYLSYINKIFLLTANENVSILHIESIFEKMSCKHIFHIDKSYEIMTGNKILCVKYTENK